MSTPVSTPHSDHSLLLASDGRLRPSWRFVLAVVWFVLASSVAATVATVAYPASVIPREAVFRPLMLVLLLFGYRFFLRVFDDVRERPLAKIGLDVRTRWLGQSVVGLAIGTALVTAIVVVIGNVGQLTIRLSFSGDTLPRFWAVVFIVATAAMAEEVVFRGYPFQSLAQAAGPVAAVVVTSALFGASHFLNPHFSWIAVVNTFVVGVLLAIAYLRTRSLWLSWGVHFAWNFVLGVVFGLPVSGVTWFAVLGQGSASGPPWATGGSYGIEASWSATGIVVIGIAATWWISGRAGLQRQTPPAILDTATQTTAREKAHLS